MEFLAYSTILSAVALIVGMFGFNKSRSDGGYMFLALLLIILAFSGSLLALGTLGVNLRITW